MKAYYKSFDAKEFPFGSFGKEMIVENERPFKIEIPVDELNKALFLPYFRTNILSYFSHLFAAVNYNDNGIIINGDYTKILRLNNIVFDKIKDDLILIESDGEDEIKNDYYIHKKLPPFIKFYYSKMQKITEKPLEKIKNNFR